MVQRYRGHTIVPSPDPSDDRHGVVVFEGDSDELVGEYDSADEAREALDRRLEHSEGPRAGR